MLQAMPMDVEKACREDLFAIADAYASYAGVSLVTVSKKFKCATRFMTEFRDGECTVTLTKLTKILKEFSREWPKELAWPNTKLLKRVRYKNPQVSAE